MSQAGDRHRRGRHGFIVFGLIAVVLGVFLAVGQLAAGNYKGSTFKCLVEGPSSELAEVSERAGVVTGYPTMWPLGRACEWDRADGAGTITTYSGSWLGTIVALGLLVGGITLAGFAPLGPLRRMKPGCEPG
ncbi:hypothetical protein [Humibacter sp. RRB41]|uniref:hypothetical protein n=1 Tax=Humibacter sp. RRB41 TaxID=2919946 RepID=UPI001FAAE28D|nr:hypothetical protein [Humibacter sp. RRB41]